MTNTRRLMMSGGGGDLPSGYTRLEYIEGQGGLVSLNSPEQIVNYYAEFYVITKDNVEFLPGIGLSSDYYLDYTGSGYSYMSNVKDGKNSVMVSYKKMEVNGPFSPNSQAVRFMGKNDPHILKMRLYAFQAWNLYGECVLNLIPCTRISDGSFGLYDTESDVYSKYLVLNYFLYEEDESDGTYYYKLKYPATSTIVVTATAYWDDGSEETVTKTIQKGGVGGWWYYRPKSINIQEDAFQKYTTTSVRNE